jgi:beta-galactosidase
MYECKRIFQPIECTWENGKIRIQNRSVVTNTNRYDVRLVLKADGKIVFSKQIPSFHILPEKDSLFDVGVYLPQANATYTEQYIELHFLLKESNAWADKGFEVASNQFLYFTPTTKNNSFIQKSKPNFFLQESLNGVLVSGKNFSMFFSRFDNGLSSYMIDGIEQIKSPLIPNFKRPLTDNDKRGWKPQRKLKQWYDYELKLTSTNFKTLKDGTVMVSMHYSLINDSATVQVDYNINDIGSIKVDYQLQVKNGLPNIPKVGMQMGIERSYENIEWYGRGPFENYIDKQTAADVSIYQKPINQFMETYIVPQESGNRTDVRWMRFTNTKQQGLLVVADSLLSMNASIYTDSIIQNARHTNKLVDAGFVKVDIDLIQMGVGGNDSWSDVAAPLEQYQIKAKPYHYSFYLMPYTKTKKEISEDVRKIKY